MGKIDWGDGVVGHREKKRILCEQGHLKEESEQISCDWVTDSQREL